MLKSSQAEGSGDLEGGKADSKKSDRAGMVQATEQLQPQVLFTGTSKVS